MTPEQQTPASVVEGMKPCPFCGGCPVPTEAMNEHWIACGSCGASAAIRGRFKLAVEAWNRRAPSAPTEQADRIDDLRSILPHVERLSAEREGLREALQDCVAVLTNPCVGTVEHDDSRYAAINVAVEFARAALAQGERPRTADDIKSIVMGWLDADDPTAWGDFEKRLNAALTQGESRQKGEVPSRFANDAAAPEGMREAIAGAIHRAMCDGQGDHDVIKLATDDILAIIAKGKGHD